MSRHDGGTNDCFPTARGKLPFGPAQGKGGRGNAMRLSRVAMSISMHAHVSVPAAGKLPLRGARSLSPGLYSSSMPPNTYTRSGHAPAGCSVEISKRVPHSRWPRETALHKLPLTEARVLLATRPCCVLRECCQTTRHARQR